MSKGAVAHMSAIAPRKLLPKKSKELY